MIKLIISALAPITVATVNNTSETLEILSKVNEFYDSAWTKLLTVATFILAIGGVIVPIVIQRYQDKVLSISEKKLEDKIIKEIAVRTAEMKEEILTEVENNIKKYIKEFDSNHNILTAYMTHNQGNAYVEKDNYPEALNCYSIALTSYTLTEDQNNIIYVLKQIIFCLDNLQPKEIQKLKYDDFKDLRDSVDYAYEKNNNLNAISEEVQNIKIKLNSF